MPPISRREQVELDELLSDIYRGIETLPDHNKSQSSFVIKRRDSDNKSPIIGRAYVREFEVPESSPLVQEHKRALASASASNQPQRSTLKRSQQTGGGEYGGNYTPDSINHQHQSQSLASFLNANPASGPPSATSDNKRRVRIVDHKKAYTSDNEDDDNYYAADYPTSSNNYYKPNETSPSSSRPGGGKKSDKVKYVNTNKLIYHDETQASDSDSAYPHGGGGEDDDDIDGVTRVEYYHTTWLDRQLGRASRRRSSKELSERQVKEKAMIEELKNSLKNGAITLRQSFKGKRGSNTKNRASDDIFEDYMLDSGNNFANRNRGDGHEQAKVVKTGIATLPRHHHSHKNKHSTSQQQTTHRASPLGSWFSTTTPKKNVYSSQRLVEEAPQRVATPSAKYHQPRQTSQAYLDTLYSSQQQNQPLVSPQSEVHQRVPMQHPACSTSLGASDKANPSGYSSRTLPPKRAEQPHSLLQSHYRGNLHSTSQSKTLNRFSPKPTTPNFYPQHQQQQKQDYQHQRPIDSDKMPHSVYSNTNSATYCPSPSQQPSGMRSPLQQQNTFGASINSVPAASDVVRSALSRSSSQISVNQLNKNVNLLSESIPVTSPMTPTHQLKPSSPSLSPSPTPSHLHQQFTSKTQPLHPQQQQQQQQQQQYLPGQIVLHGTRTVGRPPQMSQPKTTTGSNITAAQHTQPQHQHQPQSSNYTNPHASLMQHRMEQQTRQPNRNTASIREFNELDSLLRSLSPGMSRSATVNTHISPGFSSKPAQASLGGYMPSNYQHQQQQQQPRQQYQETTQPQPNADIYAQVQKQQASGAAIAHQIGQQSTQGPGNQPYTIDVTDKKIDENCVQRQRQDISEFEAPIDLLPSMEDYQNIAKLNPVKNHYWYKPNMSRDRAISLLKDKPQGTFIVRDSTSFKGAYGLAVRVAKLPKNILASLRNSNGDTSAEYIRHFLIEPTGSGVRLKGYANEPVFDSLPDLIYQHSLTELALPCRLVIPRADIEDPRFNQKQKQFFDEFCASKEQAKHLPYERTSPDGGYRRYPGNVLVHNEHRIIFE